MSTAYHSIPNQEVSDERPNLLARITVEHGLYILIAVAAAVLRLIGLGNTPLSPAEANEALAVWELWQPGGEAAIVGSPIYFSISAMASQVLGFGEPIMRLAPVLFGMALVLLPWFLRHRNGRLGSLVASLLIAVSPTLTLTSRSAGGQSAALFAGLLVFIAWIRFQESSNNRWFIVLTIALALGLTSAPLFYGLLLILIIAWLTQAIMGPALIVDETGQRQPVTWPERNTIRSSLLLGLATLLLVSTAFLLKPDGLGATAELAAQWFGRFAAQADATAWFSPFLAIARYEIVLLLLGIPAILWAVRRDRPYPFLLIYWLIGGLILIFLQRGNMANVLLVTLPGILLIGTFVNNILKGVYQWHQLSFAIVILVAGGIIYVNLSRYGRLMVANQSVAGSYHLLLVAAALLVAVVLLALVWSWDKEVAQKSIIAGLLLLIVMISWSTAWWLSNVGANDTRERWIREASDDDLPLLADTMTELSWQIDNSEQNVQILSAVESPALRWYLRDFPNMDLVGALPRTVDSPLIITTADQSDLLFDGYIGADFGHKRLDTPLYLTPSEALQWWLFHESPMPVDEERVILWLRADIAGGSQ